MGLIIIWEDENGNEIEKLSQELSSDLLPNKANEYALLKYIDHYGDTMFNVLQMPDLIIDLEKLKNRTTPYNPILDSIIKIAKKCENRAHTYVKFYGD